MKHILMIKQCEITGLKYLCKTSGKNPYSYHGSGTRWRNHLNKYHKNPHSKDAMIKTTILGIYHTKEELKEAGLYYSKKFNVVESKDWANLTEEKGDGGWINDQTGKTWTVKDTSKMKGAKTQTDSVKKGWERTRGENNYQFSGWIITPWGRFASIKEAITQAKQERKNGNNYVISDAKTLNKYLNNPNEPLNKEGRRTPKEWRGKTPTDIGFNKEEK
jgi:hypothetical protein